MIGIAIKSATSYSDGEIVIVGALTVELAKVEERARAITERTARYCNNTGADIRVDRLEGPDMRFQIISKTGVSLALTSLEKPGLREKMKSAEPPSIQFHNFDYTRAGDLLFFGLPRVFRAINARRDLVQACERITKLCS